MKSSLALSPGTKSHGILTEYGSDHRRSVSWVPLDPVYTWLVPVGPDEEILILRLLSPQVRRGGVNQQSLWLLGREPRMANNPASTRIALVNARSLSNKTFILNDFFTSR